jgi:hypothetical protein
MFLKTTVTTETKQILKLIIGHPNQSDKYVIALRSSKVIFSKICMNKN